MHAVIVGAHHAVGHSSVVVGPSEMQQLSQAKIKLWMYQTCQAPTYLAAKSCCISPWWAPPNYLQYTMPATVVDHC